MYRIHTENMCLLCSRLWRIALLAFMLPAGYLPDPDWLSLQARTPRLQLVRPHS